MPILYVLRHGETEWNRIGRLQGVLDSSLTAKGTEQAKHMAKILSRNLEGQTTPKLVSSPLGRARQTADIVSAHLTIPVMFDARLSEIDMGEWNGHRKAEIENSWPEALVNANNADWNFFSPHGESYGGVRARVTSWLGEQKSDVIVVGHGLSGKLLRGAYLKLDRIMTLALAEPQDAVFRLSDGQMKLLS